MARTKTIISTTRTTDRSLQADLWLIVTLGVIFSVMEQIAGLL